MVMSNSVSGSHLVLSPTRENAAVCKVARGWDLDVERGPNWLFVKLKDGDVGISDHPPLADQLKSLLEEHATTRIVLEFNLINVPCHHLVRQLELLDQWVSDHRGVIRLCGLSDRSVKALRRSGLSDRFGAYRDRTEAVFGGYRLGRAK